MPAAFSKPAASWLEFRPRNHHLLQGYICILNVFLTPKSSFTPWEKLIKEHKHGPQSAEQRQQSIADNNKWPQSFAQTEQALFLLIAVLVYEMNLRKDSTDFTVDLHSMVSTVKAVYSFFCVCVCFSPVWTWSLDILWPEYHQT